MTPFIQFQLEDTFLVFLVSCSALTVPGFQYHILEQAVLMRSFCVRLIGKEDESFL